MILFFTWVIWIWMMVAILSDVFRSGAIIQSEFEAIETKALA